MSQYFVMPLVALGKQARVPHACMRPAILVWSSQDHFGDDFWWWITCHRREASLLELKFWTGGWDYEGRARFVRESTRTATVKSWKEARACLADWRESDGFYLPDELLDNGLCWMICHDLVPKLKWED